MGIMPSLPLSITHVSMLLKQHIEAEFSIVFLQGEISGCKIHASGHIYFALKDDQSVLDAICWRGTKTNVIFKDGDFILCKGRITTYGARSKYQFIVESAEPAGQGLLLQKIEILKEKLTQEGLFQAERKKPLPAFPRCIGLITSPTGAVIQDMMSRFLERLPCRLLLYPVNVQGNNAVSDILQALEFFHSIPNDLTSDSRMLRPDLLIIARGGGSIEDLWAFHDESLVRAVASARIPIISAIGHESDTTLIDYAADYRAPTPTAAAEIALPLMRTVQERMGHALMHLKRSVYHAHSVGSAQIVGLAYRLESIKNIPLILEQRLDDCQDLLIQGLSQWLVRSEHRWALAAQALGKGPFQELHQLQQHLERLHQDLKRFIFEKINTLHTAISLFERLLPQLSYQQTLARGFALVFDPVDKKICPSKAAAEHHTTLHVHFHDGILPIFVKN